MSKMLWYGAMVSPMGKNVLDDEAMIVDYRSRLVYTFNLHGKLAEGADNIRLPILIRSLLARIAQLM